MSTEFWAGLDVLVITLSVFFFGAPLIFMLFFGVLFWIGRHLPKKKDP